MALITEPNLTCPDTFFEALTETYKDLSQEELRDLNAKLVLVLANHIGDSSILKAALSHANSVASLAPRTKRSAA